VNGTVQPNCADVIQLIHSLTVCDVQTRRGAVTSGGDSVVVDVFCGRQKYSTAHEWIDSYHLDSQLHTVCIQSTYTDRVCQHILHVDQFDVAEDILDPVVFRQWVSPDAVLLWCHPSTSAPQPPK